MSRFKLFHLKNDMMVANFLANFIGVLLTNLFLLKTEGSMPDELFKNPVFQKVDTAFTPLAFCFVTIMTLIYEKPIRSFRVKHTLMCCRVGFGGR